MHHTRLKKSLLIIQIKLNMTNNLRIYKRNKVQRISLNTLSAMSKFCLIIIRMVRSKSKYQIKHSVLEHCMEFWQLNIFMKMPVLIKFQIQVLYSTFSKTFPVLYLKTKKVKFPVHFQVKKPIQEYSSILQFLQYQRPPLIN